VVFGVILGTGVGGGIVVDGRRAERRQRHCRRVGAQPACRLLADIDGLPPPRCYCGRSAASKPGCRARRSPPTTLRHGGEALAAEQHRAACAAGDAACEATLARYERRLAKALAQRGQHPRSAGHRARRRPVEYRRGCMRAVPRLWRRMSFPTSSRTRLLRNVHGDSSGVRGAAWLWNEK
jgi:fructokinase